MPWVDCEERARLEQEHDQSVVEFEDAQKRLKASIGITPKDQFLRLDRTADEAWQKLNRARSTLDQHIRQHRCITGAF